MHGTCGSLGFMVQLQGKSLRTGVIIVNHKFQTIVPRPRAPPGEKRSGERSRIPWAYHPKRVMTNEIARLVIIT